MYKSKKPKKKKTDMVDFLRKQREKEWEQVKDCYTKIPPCSIGGIQFKKGLEVKGTITVHNNKNRDGG
jgi:hypothetical protein